eukprot:gene8907-3798_t
MVVGTTVPSISGLTWIKGGPINIDDPNAGVLILEFWATWCPPCRDTIPYPPTLAPQNPSTLALQHLTQLQAAYKSKGVRIIGITTEQDVTKVKNFVDGQGSSMDYAVALMTKAGASGIPHAFIVDATRKIVFSGHPSDPGFDSALKTATAGAAAAKEEVALPLVTESFEELMTMSAKQIKEILKDRNIGFADCFEKEDLVRKVLDRCTKVVYYK